MKSTIVSGSAIVLNLILLFLLAGCICAEIRISLKQRFIVSLIGQRRDVKSANLYQIISDLLMDGASKSNNLIFSFNEKSAGGREVNDTYVSFQNKDPRGGRVRAS